MNIEEMEKLVCSLRLQATQLNNAADSIEASLVPWKATQAMVDSGMKTMSQFWGFLPEMFKSKD